MIRVALDRSACTPEQARTGIGRYVDELTAGLQTTGGVELATGADLDLWSGLAAGGVRGAVREYLLLPASVRRHGADVYHATASRAPGVRVPVPLVVTIHDFAAFEWPSLQGRRRGAQLRRQIRRAAQAATLIVTPSASIADELKSRFPPAGAKARIIHHGVALGFARPRQAGTVPTFVSVATLERRKNLTTLVDAFALVLKQSPEARLRLIGQTQNDAAEIRRRLRSFGIAEAVSVDGYLSEDALAAAYSGATATVYPSLYEGFGLPILESMAAGAPVIAADRPAAREISAGAALLVDPLDSGAMAGAMLRLMQEPALCASLSAAGRARTAGATWARSAAAHAEVYREAVDLFRRGARR